MTKEFKNKFGEILNQVIRDRLQLRVKINGTAYLNDSLTSFRPLQAQVLFLGGLPPSARLKRRQTTSSIASQLASGQQQPIGILPNNNNNNNVLEGRNFKGILQDIQVLSPFQQLFSINFDDNQQLTQTENKLEDGYRKVCLKVTKLGSDFRVSSPVGILLILIAASRNLVKL
jgi:hypothetical protein